MVVLSTSYTQLLSLCVWLCRIGVLSSRNSRCSCSSVSCSSRGNSLSLFMIRIQRLTSIVVLLAMVGAWCPPCLAAIQAASSCCTQPCDACACGFEAMSADVDPAAAVVVASPLTLEPALLSSYVAPFAALRAGSRTSPSDLPLSPFPFPLSTSARLSILSVYLI